MLFPNGDILEGEWKEDEIVRGKFVKGNADHLPRCVEELFQTELSSLPRKRKEEFTTITIPYRKWENYFSAPFFTTKEIIQSIKDRFGSTEVGTKELSILF